MATLYNGGGVNSPAMAISKSCGIAYASFSFTQKMKFEKVTFNVSANGSKFRIYFGNSNYYVEAYYQSSKSMTIDLNDYESSSFSVLASVNGSSLGVMSIWGFRLYGKNGVN